MAEHPIQSIRCEADPIYRLLLFGQETLQMTDGTTTRYVDLLLSNAKAILYKRYGQSFQKSRWIQEMFRLLENQHDLAVKIFVMHFIIHQEPSVARAMADLYDTEAQDALFPGESGPQHFFLYLQKFLHQAMEAHLNHANNKYTIVGELQGFVQKATQEYIMGPQGGNLQ